MRTFIFAIGGTGARVLRSLTMLLASGCKDSSVANPIIPIVIDYDTDNGDTKRTQDLLELYRDLHNEAYNDNDEINGQPLSEHFFCNPLKMLRDICDPTQIMVHGLDNRSKFNLYLDQTKTNISYADYLSYDNLNIGNGTYVTRQLLDCLYDSSPTKIQGQDNPKAELHMNFHDGFKGCPNIGCIVTKQLEDSPEIKLAVNTLIQPNDKIIVIGSVFGGTGASGIPMILDMLQSNPNSRTAKKAVIAVLPYFSVTPPDGVKSAIDSNTFIAKAKSAISAYESTINNQVDGVYYVGDETSNAYANHQGSQDQKNNAHYVELVSAMCIMDFITRAVGTANGYECELENWNNEGLDISSFYKIESQDKYIYPMSRFKLFSTFCKKYLLDGKNNRSDIWLNGIEKDNARITAIGDVSCQNYRDMIKEFIKCFDEWISELEDVTTHRPLKLYNDTLEYTNVWNHVKLEKKVVILGKKPIIDEKEHFCHNLSDNFNSLNPSVATGIQNRPAYLFWRGAKYTMDKIDDVLRNNHLI